MPVLHTKPRKRLVIQDSSSESERSLSDSVISIDDSLGNNDVEKDDKPNDIVDLVDTMNRVKIGSNSNDKPGKRSANRVNLHTLTFDFSDSDSSFEVFEPTFKPKAKPKTITLNDSSSDSSVSSRTNHRNPHARGSYIPTSGRGRSQADDKLKKKTSADTNRKDAGCASADLWALDRDRNEYILRSSTTSEMPKFRIPAKLYGQLFEHQQDGVSWMAGLHCQGLGGLLGDDMGMGKTYMALTYLGGLMRARTIRNALIVAPLSVLRSWETEASKVVNQCVPNVRTVTVSSSMGKATRLRHLRAALECPSKSPCIIITTYGLIGSSPLDFTHEHFAWDYVVLDEAHKIKNPSAQVSKSCRRVARDPSTHRLILTGTPIMNNLKELWALFDFATSGKVLGTLPRFKNRYSSPIEDARSADATGHTIRIGEKANKELQQKIKPYFLQRLKIDFLADKLPKKRDFVIWTHLSRYQRAMYSRYVNAGDSAVAQVLSGISTSPLEAVTWLKKLCGHPILLDKGSTCERMSPEELKESSSKLQVLDTLVERLRNKGHRTLIFSQSTKMLDIIEIVLSRMRLSRIDGSTKEKDRQRRVDDFNGGRGSVEVMLLSTKAAGVGLTLTGADRAIIYDPSWNPAEDSQAVDRCYRIGQKKEVAVFRFITAGTVEEKMYEKQVHKDGIRRAVMTSMGNETMRYFDKDSLRKLFTLGPEGECEFFERLRASGLASDDHSPESLLASHGGVVGVSSHDHLYTGKNLIDITNGSAGKSISTTKSRENPFSSASTPPQLGYTNKPVVENSRSTGPSWGQQTETKVLGRSQRALNKAVASTLPSKTANTLSVNDKENRTTPISDDIEKLPSTVFSNQNERTEKVFQRVDQARITGNHAFAMELLMNLLENEYRDLPKDKKVEVHKRTALIAYEMQWL